MYRAVTTLDEGIGKATDVQPLDTFFAIVAAAEELDACIGMVGEEVSDL